jgi:hypothetical protein
MTLKEFIGYYKIAKDKKAECEKRVQKNKYVPFLSKIAECENIVRVTMEKDDSFVQNTPGRFIFFNMTLIKTYTDIEFDMENGLQLTESYDTLNECGAIETLINCMPVHELKEFKTILDMCVDDYMVNHRDLTSYIDKKLNGLVELALENAKEKEQGEANG